MIAWLGEPGSRARSMIARAFGGFARFSEVRRVLEVQGSAALKPGRTRGTRKNSYNPEELVQPGRTRRTWRRSADGEGPAGGVQRRSHRDHHHDHGPRTEGAARYERCRRHGGSEGAEGGLRKLRPQFCL